MLVGRWLEDGALRNRGPASPCRQDYFSATGTLAGADWSRCFAVLMCAHWSTLYFRTSAFTLAPLAARSGGTPCSMRYHCSFSGAGVRENSTIIFPIPTPDNPSSFSNRSHSDLSICSFVVAEATSPRCSSVTISSSAILPGALTALINHSFSTLRRIPVAIDQHNEVIATATAMAIIILFISLSSNVTPHRIPNPPRVRNTVKALVRQFLSFA